MTGCARARYEIGVLPSAPTVEERKMMKDERARLVSIKDAAQELGLAPVTLRSWIAKRTIGSVKLGRSVRIPSSELDRLVERGSIPALPERR